MDTSSAIDVGASLLKIATGSTPLQDPNGVGDPQVAAVIDGARNACQGAVKYAQDFENVESGLQGAQKAGQALGIV